MELTVDVPQCVSSHLKEFYLHTYEGWECDSEFIKFIMKNARFLRSIHIDSVLQEDHTKKMIQRLSLCPIGSENCEFFFCQSRLM